MKIKIYGASKLDEAQTWRDLKNASIHLVSRWPNTFKEDNDTSPGECRKGWIENEEDIRAADILIVLPPRNGGNLRGALVEAGMAIGLGKKVIIVGQCPDYGTWRWHPTVYNYSTLEAAISFLTAG